MCEDNLKEPSERGSEPGEWVGFFSVMAGLLMVVAIGASMFFDPEHIGILGWLVGYLRGGL